MPGSLPSEIGPDGRTSIKASAALLSFTEVFHRRTLSGLSLTLNRGEFFALLAGDGAARSDVALLAAGLIRPDRGEVKLPNATPGLIFPVPGQGLIAATVLEEVRLGAVWRGEPEDVVRQRSEGLLRQFGLWERRHQAPSTLSGGEKQRLAIAAALAADPSCLVMADPIGMLDPPGRRLVAATAKELARQGRGVLWLGDDPAQVLEADRLAVLSGGRVVWAGSPSDLAELGERLAEWGVHPLPLTALREALNRGGLALPGRGPTAAALVEEICSVWTRSI